jgi:hypothetical protein
LLLRSRVERTSDPPRRFSAAGKAAARQETDSDAP